MLAQSLLLLAGGGLCVATATLPTVDLGYEIHQATLNESGQYYNFSNVRYAAPPLGNLRFAAPQPPTTNGTKVFNDGQRAVTCHQALPAWFVYSNDWVANGTAAFNISAGYTPPPLAPYVSDPDPTASEDCLFLDLMVPQAAFNSAGQGKGAPVMLWIHGGGYTLGSKTLYSPSAAGLIKASQSQGGQGIIWIGINYRLGAFGWLSSKTFQSQSGLSNAGLYDQRFALEWVQQHISKFGGDPNRVTVIGESAGGGSTLHQVTAFGGAKKAPFHQAITQSPGFQPTPSDKLQEAIYQRFLNTANVSNLAEARSLSTEALQLVNYIMVGDSTPYGTFTFNPVVDGIFAPALPGQLLLEGRFDKSLKVMAGHNVLEGLEFQDPFAQNETVFENDLRIYFPTITDAVVNYISYTLYPPVYDGSQGYTTPTGRSEIMVTDAFFICNTNWLARAYNNMSHNYLFSVPPSLHGQDIYYTYWDGPNPALVTNDTLAVIMQRYLTNFAMTGDPNAASLPYFPSYGADATILNLNQSTIAPIKDNAATERCAWWQKGLYA